jgi:hypothetical protein
VQVNDVLDFGKQEHGSGDLRAYHTEADLRVLAHEAMTGELDPSLAV